MEVNQTAFVSPTANAPYSFAQPLPFIERILDQVNFWSICLTLLLLAVTYDQCKCCALAFKVHELSFDSVLQIPETWHRWSCLENALHWALSRIHATRLP